MVIPDGLTAVEEYTFEYCESLTSIVFPDGLKTIGTDAFNLCKHLTSVTLPGSLESIEAYAFSGSTGLKTVTYLGTEDDWANIAIGISNTALTNCDIIFADTHTHEHSYAADWSKDGYYHWHAATCEHVTEVKDKAEHSWDDGTVTKAATESETGIKTYSCTVCKQTKTETIPKLAPATAPVISVVGTKGRPGEEITVSVVLKNNPGIGAASFAIEYDHSKLLLTGFEDGGLRGWLVGVGAGEKANWTTTDYLNNNMLNGEILKLKFNILDTAALGETVVSVKEIDVTDVDAEPVEFSGQSGTVNIIRVIPGDVNDDGKVGSGDALLVKKHLAGYEVSLVMEAADVNGDGKVGSADALLIQKYLAGYDVILK